MARKYRQNEKTPGAVGEAIFSSDEEKQKNTAGIDLTVIPRRFFVLTKYGGKSVRPGFTLIEVLVAVVVIALGCLAVLAFHSSAIRSGSQADTLTAASFLAESQLELLRSLEFDNIETVMAKMGSNNSCATLSNDPCGGFSNCYTECLSREGEPCAGGNTRGCFRRTTGIHAQTPTSRSHTASVTVQWRGPGNMHSITYDSMLSAFGLTQ